MERYSLRANGRKVALAITLISSIFTTGFTMAEPAFEVIVDSVVVGAASNKESAEIAIRALVMEENSRNSSNNVVINDIEIKRAYVNSELIDEEKLQEKLSETLEYKVLGQELTIDGKTYGVLKSISDIEYVISTIKSKYLVEYSEGDIKAFTFKEKIEVSEIETGEDRIEDLNIVLDRILADKKIGEYQISEGESLDSIIEETNNTEEDLLELNPNLEEDLILENEISFYKPVLTPLVLEEIEYLEPIEFEVEMVEDDSLYEGDTKVLVEGKNGVQTVLAKAVKEDNLKKKNEIVSIEIIEEPIIEILAVGTKERPSTEATGVFMNPVSGQLSSKYGSRFGRFHYGIDIRAPKETSIVAADGGKVVTVTSHSTYGKYVEIDHGNGYMTRYAHLNSFSVNVGDLVFKGQKIGGVGITGRATGYHLHLEVLNNGNNENPLNYFKY